MRVSGVDIDDVFLEHANNNKPEDENTYQCDISMHATPTLVSFISASVTKELREKYINYDYNPKRKRAEAFCELAEFENLVPPNEIQEYIELLKERKDTMLSDIYENSIFEWVGGSTLLMTGIVSLW